MEIDWLLPIGPNENIDHVNSCLKSIYSQVSLAEDGLIVVCDADQWEGFIKPPIELDFKLVCPPEVKNAAAFRNVGLSLVVRSVVLFHDADDVSNAYRRELVVNTLASADIVCSGYETIDELGRSLGHRKVGGNNDKFFFRNNIPLPTLAIRKEFILAEKFNEELAMGEDNELIGRVLKKKPVVVRLDVPLIKYRIIRSKHGYRRGITGIKNEIKYRQAMFSYASFFQRLYLIVGALACVGIKAFPRPLFDSIHRRLHNL